MALALLAVRIFGLPITSNRNLTLHESRERRTLDAGRRSGNLLLVTHGPLDQRTGREKLRAFVSDDDGKTWQGGLILDERGKSPILTACREMKVRSISSMLTIERPRVPC